MLPVLIQVHRAITRCRLFVAWVWSTQLRPDAGVSSVADWYWRFASVHARHCVHWQPCQQAQGSVLHRYQHRLLSFHRSRCTPLPVVCSLLHLVDWFQAAFKPWSLCPWFWIGVKLRNMTCELKTMDASAEQSGSHSIQESSSPCKKLLDCKIDVNCLHTMTSVALI